MLPRLTGGTVRLVGAGEARPAGFGRGIDADCALGPHRRGQDQVAQATHEGEGNKFLHGDTVADLDLHLFL